MRKKRRARGRVGSRPRELCREVNATFSSGHLNPDVTTFFPTVNSTTMSSVIHMMPPSDDDILGIRQWFWSNDTDLPGAVSSVRTLYANCS